MSDREDRRIRAANALAEHYRLERDRLRMLVKRLQDGAVPLDEHWEVAATAAERQLRRLRFLRAGDRVRLRAIRLGRLGKTAWEVARGLERSQGATWYVDRGERRVRGPRGSQR